MVQARQPHNGISHLNISLAVPPTCRISRCQVSVACKWQLASRLHLLQFGCRPNVPVSSVQWLKGHNKNPESQCGRTSWLRICYGLCGRGVDYSWETVAEVALSYLHVSSLLAIRYQGCGCLCYDGPGSELLFCPNVLFRCLMAWMTVPRTYLRFVTWISLPGSW